MLFTETRDDFDTLLGKPLGFMSAAEIKSHRENCNEILGIELNNNMRLEIAGELLLAQKMQTWSMCLSVGQETSFRDFFGNLAENPKRPTQDNRYSLLLVYGYLRDGLEPIE